MCMASTDSMFDPWALMLVNIRRAAIATHREAIDVLMD